MAHRTPPVAEATPSPYRMRDMGRGAPRRARSLKAGEAGRGKPSREVRGYHGGDDRRGKGDVSRLYTLAICGCATDVTPRTEHLIGWGHGAVPRIGE